MILHPGTKKFKTEPLTLITNDNAIGFLYVNSKTDML